MTDPVTAAVQHALASGLLARDQRVVVGVSGGPDSVALLLALHAAALPVVAAHLNHRLRGEESDDDEAAVRAIASARGIPLHVERADPTRFERGNLEERARAERYAFLARTARAVGAAAIAVGHTADDQIETLFLRLLRGAGPAGLGGMAPRTSLTQLTGDDLPIVRPLLDVPRDATLAYCRAQGVEPRLDTSNVSDRFLRNRLRRRFLPALLRENPRLRERLTATMALLRDQHAFIRSEVERRWSEVAGPSEHSLRVDPLTRWPAALASEAIRRAAEQLTGPPSPLTLEHVARVLDAARAGAPRRLHLPRDLEAVITGPLLELRRRRAPAPPPAVLLTVPGTARFGPWELRADRRIATDVRRTSGPLSVWVRSAGPFLIRARRPGDRFRPLGGAGTVKVQDELVNRKTPRDERDFLPVVTAEERIVWLVGSRVSAEEAVMEGAPATWIEARRDAGASSLLQSSAGEGDGQSRAGRDDPN